VTTTTSSLPATGGVLDQVRLHHVTDLDTLDAFRRWISGRLDGPLSADTESAGLAFHRDRHRMTQVGDKRDGWSFPPGWFGAVNEILARWARRNRIGFYNAPYDWLVLSCQDGLELPWASIDDAQLACHLVDSAAILNLKSRAAKDIDPAAIVYDRALDAAKRKNGWDYASTPDDLPEYWMYGAMDPVLASWLLDKHMPVVRNHFSVNYDLEIGYARMCAAMMRAGMMIDQPYIEGWMAQIDQYNNETMAWLRGQWGISSVESNAAVGQALEDAGICCMRRTPSGMVSIDKESLEHYAIHHPEQAPLLRSIRGARKAQAINGRYLQKFLDMADDGVVHYSIHSVGAQRTGRSSVKSPPMQTFDRDVPVIRGSFIPRPGHCFISWDANQIELRLAASFSGDRQLLADIAHCDTTGESFFLNFAETIYGPIEKTDPRYTTTKNTSYAMIYGSGEETAALTAGVPLPEILPIYQGFKTRYPDLAKMMALIISNGKRRGFRPQVRTDMGRVLFADWDKAYSLVDYKIQGSAAEILKEMVLRMDAAGYGHMLRLTAHDELLAEVPIEIAQQVLRAGIEIMTDLVRFAVPITWDGKIMEQRWVK
jgi:DNA polymerase I-like protein with 3'-5' exonuclease and polymerase domains